MNPEYTIEQIKDAGRIADLLGSLPPDKRFILELIADAFINGMNAQERLMAAERPSA